MIFMAYAITKAMTDGKTESRTDEPSSSHTGAVRQYEVGEAQPAKEVDDEPAVVRSEQGSASTFSGPVRG